MRKLSHPDEDYNIGDWRGPKVFRTQKTEEETTCVREPSKRKGLVVKAKTHQLHTLEDTHHSKEENRILQQNMTELEEATDGY